MLQELTYDLRIIHPPHRRKQVRVHAKGDGAAILIADACGRDATVEIWQADRFIARITSGKLPATDGYLQ